MRGTASGRPPSAGPQTEMKAIAHSRDYRVREGDDVDLKKWPTLAKHGHRSKEDYQAKLAKNTARLSLSLAISGQALIQKCGSEAM